MKREQSYLFLAVCILLIIASFGVLIPWLGFYSNDWLILFANRYPTSQITSTLSQLNMIRPGAAYQVLIAFINTNPVIWQILTLMLRLGAIFSFWIWLGTLWPAKKKEITWAALIMLVYPAFSYHSLAVSNSLIWLSLGSFFISNTVMLWSLRKPGSRITWLSAGLLAQALAYLTIPILAIFEFIRIAVLWYANDDIPKDTVRFREVIRQWLPYAASVTVILLFRFWMAIKEKQELGPGIIATEFSKLQSMVSSAITLFFGSWAKTIEPSQIQLTDRFFLISLLISILAAVIIGLFLKKMNFEIASRDYQHEAQYQIIRLGILFIIIGFLLMIWNFRIFDWAPQQDLAILTCICGASLLIVVAIDRVIDNEGRKILLVSLLVGIGVGYQLRNANVYRWDWIDQTRFYWQLHWRAPAILPATLVLTDQENFEGEILPTAVALNLSSSKGDREPNYWLADISGGAYGGSGLSMEKVSGLLADHQKAGAIVISYQPSRGHCLWVLSPVDVERMEISKSIRSIVPVSDLDRILASPEPGKGFLNSIFKREPDHTWCYYYQKAELARQFEDWQTIRTLAKEVHQQKFEPNNLQEWSPFLEAYLRTNDWSKVQELGDQIYQANPTNSTWLCGLISTQLLQKEVEEQNQAQLRIISDKYFCND